MKKIIIYITAAITVFTYFGCDNKEMGIFYSIEQERKVEDNTIENYATIGSMVFIDDTYYAASGTVYMVDALENFEYHGGSTSVGTWDDDPAFPADSKLCFSLGVTGSAGSEKLFGVLYDKSSSDFTTSLYEKSGGEWTAVAETAEMNVEKILGTEDTLFILSYSVSGSNVRSYSIHTFDGTSTPNEVASDLPHTAIFDTAKDSNSDYWIICGTGLYSIPEASLSGGTLTAETSVSFAGESLKGIHYSSIYTGLFVTQENGTVYYLPDGGAWSELDNEIPYVPGDLIDFTMADGTELILAGTSNGYYELEKTSSMTGTDITGSFTAPSFTTKTSSYQTLDLNYAIVHSFFTHTINEGESTEERIFFALTQNNGLWSNAFYENGSEYRVWDIE